MGTAEPGLPPTLSRGPAHRGLRSQPTLPPASDARPGQLPAVRVSIGGHREEAAWKDGGEGAPPALLSPALPLPHHCAPSPAAQHLLQQQLTLVCSFPQACRTDFPHPLRQTQKPQPSSTLPETLGSRGAPFWRQRPLPDPSPSGRSCLLTPPCSCHTLSIT